MCPTGTKVCSGWGMRGLAPSEVAVSEMGVDSAGQVVAWRVSLVVMEGSVSEKAWERVSGYPVIDGKECLPPSEGLSCHLAVTLSTPLRLYCSNRRQFFVDINVRHVLGNQDPKVGERFAGFRPPFLNNFVIL